MMINKKRAIFFIAFISFAFQLYPATIYFKNGKIINAPVVEKSNTYVVVKLDAGKLRIYNFEIDKIVYDKQDTVTSTLKSKEPAPAGEKKYKEIPKKPEQTEKEEKFLPPEHKKTLQEREKVVPEERRLEESEKEKIPEEISKEQNLPLEIEEEEIEEEAILKESEEVLPSQPEKQPLNIPSPALKEKEIFLEKKKVIPIKSEVAKTKAGETPAVVLEKKIKPPSKPEQEKSLSPSKEAKSKIPPSKTTLTSEEKELPPSVKKPEEKLPPPSEDITSLLEEFPEEEFYTPWWKKVLIVFIFILLILVAPFALFLFNIYKVAKNHYLNSRGSQHLNLINKLMGIIKNKDKIKDKDLLSEIDKLMRFNEVIAAERDKLKSVKFMHFLLAYKNDAKSSSLVNQYILGVYPPWIEPPVWFKEMLKIIKKNETVK